MNNVFGLDIGTRNVVGTVGHRTEDGAFIVEAQYVRQHETRSMLDGQIHDIGKVGIPDNVLFKPDKLNSEEYNIIKNHTLIGYKTIESLISESQRKTTLSMAGEIARSHHENWDGSGYPDGLNGEDIPLSARIVALADFYDALVSKRVYKESWTHDDVVKEIFRQSGKKLDPYVVSGFLSIESEFQKISSALAE